MKKKTLTSHTYVQGTMHSNISCEVDPFLGLPRIFFIIDECISQCWHMDLWGQATQKQMTKDTYHEWSPWKILDGIHQDHDKRGSIEFNGNIGSKLGRMDYR
jgi:hypothetical protein